MTVAFVNGLKDPSYDAISVGETFDPVTVVLDSAYLATARFCLDDYDVTLDGSGRQIVPGTAIARDLQQLFLTRYDPNRIVGLHQAEEITFAAPAVLGEAVTLTGTCVDKFQKRGKGYFVLDCRAENSRGELLVRQVSTEIMEMPNLSPRESFETKPATDIASRRISGIWPTDRHPAVQFDEHLTPGIPIGPLEKACDLAQIAVFSGIGLGRYNAHTDVRVARHAGFATALAQGMMETCWMSQMLARFFGGAWNSGGWIKTNYLRPVLAGDTITLRAVLTSVAADTAEIEIWAENQHQQMTAAGWARYCISPSAI